MDRDEILAMTTDDLRRHARRTAKAALGAVQLEHIQDVRQPVMTDRREGWYRGHMAALLTDAGRYRRVGGSLRVARTLIAAAREHRRVLFGHR